jgi:hypothetical protein
MHLLPARDQSEAERSNGLPVLWAEHVAHLALKLGEHRVSATRTQELKRGVKLNFGDSARYACSFAVFR